MPEVRNRLVPLGQLIEETFAGEWGFETPQIGCARSLVVRSTEIKDRGSVELKTAVERYVPADKIAAKGLRDGDIVIESAGGSPARPVGRPAIVRMEEGSSPVVTSNFVRTLRFDSKQITQGFAIHALRHLYAQPRFGATQQKTTGIINLNFPEFKKLEIWVPGDSDRQDLITEILDAIDDAVTESDAMISKLSLAHQALVHDLTTRGLDDKAGVRDAERAEDFRMTELGFLPRSWNVEPIGRMVSGLALGTASRGATEGRDQLRLLKMGNLGWDTLDTSFCERIDVQRVACWKDAVLLDGDLLFNTRNTPELVGKTAAYDQQDRRTICDNNILRIRFPAEKMDGRFAAACMANGAGKSRLLALATGTTSVAAIYWRDLRDFKVPVPPREEREEIVRRLEASRERIRRERELRFKIADLREGLRDDLLTGRKPVLALREAAE